MAPIDLQDWQVRAARADDLDALLELAGLTGGGFTNLPHDRSALENRIAWSSQSYATPVVDPDDEMYLLVLEHRPSGRIVGTSCLFSRLGVRWPFYSYKLTALSMQSRELGRTFRTEVLHLVNDFDGASEVGGLFLHPDFRTGGLGRLLARSRYMFVAMHRARFGARMLAELRGRIKPDGSSDFWNGLAGRFFGMSFQEADHFNGINGNQFIADLMPKYPVYVAMLPEAARACLGEPHDAGRAAQKMLIAEGFAFNGYVDIFDGGPTMDTRTDLLRAIREAAPATVAHGEAGTDARLVCSGKLSAFRCAAVPASLSTNVLLLHDDAGFPEDDEVFHAPF